MRGMTLENIAKICNGKYYGGEDKKTACALGITIDSRKVEENYLFIPIKGERVDGHSFIPQVFDKKAICTLSECLLEDNKYPYILVDSCEQALKDIAEYYLEILGITVVGITGSVGKTSTKEMIASVLKEKFQILKTEGNYNNEIGLPLTIFNLREEHEVAVLEMGISDFGEMHRLAKVAKPDICVITNIGLCHLENLKTREGILKAKSEIFDFLKPDSRVILNGDDDMLRNLNDVYGKKPIFYGKEGDNQIFADHIRTLGLKGTSCMIHDGNKKVSVTIPIPGEHMIYNSLAAYVVGKELGLNLEQIKTGIERVAFSKGRTNLINAAELTIIDDCYNANPVSMKAALDVLSYGTGRKVAILGDMFELGEKEKELHIEVGRYADSKNIDLIICVGSMAKSIADGIKHKKVLYYEKKEELINELPKIVKKEDTVLVKASHSMGFEEIVEQLKGLSI